MCDNNSVQTADIYMHFENQRIRTHCICSRVFLSPKKPMLDVESELEETDDNLDLSTTENEETENEEDENDECSSNKQSFDDLGKTASSHLPKQNGADAPTQEFDNYWAEYGDQLILDSWIKEYGKNMNPDCLENTWVTFEPIINKGKSHQNRLDFDGWLKEYEKYITLDRLDLLNTKFDIQAELSEVQESEGEPIESSDYDSYWQELWQEHSRKLYQSTCEEFMNKRKENDVVCNKISEESNNDFLSSVKRACHVMGLVFTPDYSVGCSSRIKSGWAIYDKRIITFQNLGLKIRFRKHNKIPSEGRSILSNGDVPVLHNNELSKNEGEEVHSRDKMESELERTYNRNWKKLYKEIAKDPLLKKYWQRRYQLFSKFDKGIKLDKESWFSVTPEFLAEHTAQRCRCDVIIDAFCGAGGNAIQFAFCCERVIAVDIDPEKIALARHNAALYGVEDRIEFIVGNFLQIAPSLQADVVFLSPPWGGPQVLKCDVFDVETMLPIPGSRLMGLSRAITPDIGLYMPKNVNCAQLIMLAAGDYINIEQDFSRNKFMAITAYYGGLSDAISDFVT